MPSAWYKPQQTIYTLQTTLRTNSEQLAALGKYARPPISRSNHFSICSCTDRPDVFNPLPQMTGCRMPVLMSYHPTCAALISVRCSSLFLPSYGHWCLGFFSKTAKKQKKKLFFVSAVAAQTSGTEREIQGEFSSTLLGPLSLMTDTVFPSPAEIFKCMFLSHWITKWIRGWFRAF